MFCPKIPESKNRSYYAFLGYKTVICRIESTGRALIGFHYQCGEVASSGGSRFSLFRNVFSKAGSTGRSATGRKTQVIIPASGFSIKTSPKFRLQNHNK